MSLEVFAWLNLINKVTVDCTVVSNFVGHAVLVSGTKSVLFHS